MTMHREAVTSEMWWEFRPQERVMTVDNLPGRVEAVLDGPAPGAELYEVVLDRGMGGGMYSSGQLRRIEAGRREGSIATEDYPELANIGATPPPEYAIPAQQHVNDLAGLLLDHLNQLGLVTASDGGDHSHSAMIALEIPPEVQDKVAVDGGVPPEQMHVTLAHVPDVTDEHLAKMHEIAGAFSKMVGPLQGVIGGLGQFPEGEDGTPYYVPVDIPHLNDLQGSMETALKSAGVPVSTDHAFVPHMTLTYRNQEDPDTEPEPVEHTEITAPGLVVAHGDLDWTHYPFTGGAEKTAGFFHDLMNGGGGGGGQHTLMNYNWCRFRKDNKCHYSKDLDEAGTALAGYPVWSPQDRGFCWRASWADQKACKISEPGGNVPGGRLDATVPYEQGGQHGGYIDPADTVASLHTADYDPAQPREDSGKWTRRPGKGDHVIDSNLAGALRGGSLEKHLQPAGDGTFTVSPERQQLHDAIIEQALEGKQPEDSPTLAILGGGPASGKSTMLRSGQVPGVDPDAVQINPDDIKGQLPEYQQMIAAKDPKAAAYAHEESSYLSKRLQQAAIERGLNITLDGTGDSSAKKLLGKIENARKHGYTVNGYYATVPTDMAVERAQKRGERTGRFVPEASLRHTHRNVSDVFSQHHGAFDNAYLFDTTDGARPIFTNLGGQVSVHDPQAWQEFQDKARE